MKFRTMMGILIVSTLTLAGCNGAASAPAGNPEVETRPNAESARSMDTTNQLVLGTLMLEETSDAVTPEQAATLLPLWQLLQGGTLQSDAETEALLKQIEATLSDAQRQTIADMDLTMDNIQTWAQENGIEMNEFAPPEGAGGFGGNGTMSDEDRQAMAAQFQNMTEEERAEAMAERGFERPEGAGEGTRGNGQRPAAGMGMMRGGNVLLTPLIELLSARASE